MTHHTLYIGDALEVLRTLPDESVDAVVTDPPYELGFMSYTWDRSGVAHRPDVWRECLRVAKPGAHLLSFGGTRTYHRMVCAVEDAGWEILDMIVWLYGQGMPKSPELGDGQGTALKPALDPIVLARKPIVGDIKEHLAAHGTGVLNIDACRIPANGDDLGGGIVSSRAGGWDRPWKRDPAAVNAAIERGRDKILTAEALGRWPANVALDPDAAVSLDAQSGVLTSGSRAAGVRKGMGYHGAKGDGGPELVGSAGGASRFFYVAKASTKDRAPYNTHPTVKPLMLMRWLVQLVTPKGGTVLDPFGGSGTTILAAKQLVLSSIYIDLNADYARIAERRCFEQREIQEDYTYEVRDMRREGTAGD